MGKSTITRRLFAAFSRYRPRVLTLVVLAAIGALIWLANLSEEWSLREATNAPSIPANLEFDLTRPRDRASGQRYPGLHNMSYGWPLLWRQHVIGIFVQVGVAIGVAGECYSVSRLSSNVAIWLTMLAAPAGLCEWLVRRYRPRLRFSLRTMLAAMGLAAALCGWFVAVRNRANAQDSILDAAKTPPHKVWFQRWGEHWGPKWLDVLGADRYRRRIVGAALDIRGFDEEAEREGQRLLDELKRLPNLRCLSLEAGRLTPEMADALGELRRLETLQIEIAELTADSGQSLGRALAGMRRLRTLDLGPYALSLVDPEAPRDCLAAVGNQPKLEHLRMRGWEIGGQELALLAGLGNLKSLTLQDALAAPDQSVSDPPLLSHLPPLPRLETLDLLGSAVHDRDLRYFAALQRLKSLNIARTHVTGAGLAELAPLESLEELAIDADAESLAGFEALLKIKHLRKLHLTYLDEDWLQSAGALPDEASQSSDVGGAWPGALGPLRRSKPELVIDGNVFSNRWDEEQLAPKGDTDPERWMKASAREAVRAWKEQQAGK